MTFARKAILWTLVLLGFSACATVDTKTRLDAVRELTQPSVPYEVHWAKTDEVMEQNQQKALALAQDGITREDAVAIALLNNPALQADLSLLGVAAANLTQAGLLRNPVLSLEILFPIYNADSGAGLFGWLSDLWQLPRRKRMAEIAARQADFRAALRVLEVVVAASNAWDTVVTQRGQEELAEELLEIRGQQAESTLIGFKHGLSGTIQVQQTAAAELEQLTEVFRMKQLLVQAETRLSEVLALDDASARLPVIPLALVPPYEHSLRDTVRKALDNRLDLALAQSEVERMASQLNLENTLVWRSVLIGVAWQGDFKRVSGDDNSIGPALAVELPIFDQNQAGIAAAGHRMLGATRSLEARTQMALKEVVDAYEAVIKSRSTLKTLEEDLSQASKKRLAYAREWHVKMQLPFMEVLAAEAAQLQLKSQIMETRFFVNKNQRGLHLVTWGGNVM
jgi:cobalt-zinc-cadmium efflux system outer membrane protein